MPTHVFINAKRLHPDAVLPAYQTDGAAGMDLCAIEDATLPSAAGRTYDHTHYLKWLALSRALIGTGIALAIPPGYEGQIRPRSGLAAKHGVTVLNSPGRRLSFQTPAHLAVVAGTTKSPYTTHSIRQLTIAHVNQRSTCDGCDDEPIDSDYRGEIKVLLINLGQEKVTIKRGDRIAQPRT